MYLFYPVVLTAATATAWLATHTGTEPSKALPPILVTTILLSMLYEWQHPLKAEWKMTRRTLTRRDLPFIVLGLVIERVCEVAVAAIAERTVPVNGFGPMGSLPLPLQIVAAILAFDFLWYWYHRATHRNARLWRVHGAHHSPSQMYVLMHGVFHPFDELVVRFALALVIFRFGGFTPQATMISLAIIGVVGIISHANGDIRLWALNHLLIGPETHRIHHSASHDGNFGATTSVWDQVFGTFVFQPESPEALGLADPTSYPDPERFHDVLLWPFRHGSETGTSRPSRGPRPETALKS